MRPTNRSMKSTSSPVHEGEAISGFVTAILRNIHTGIVRVHRTHNIVTDAGDIHYAQRGVNAAPTNLFDTLWLGTSASAVPAKANDSDDLTFIAATNKTVKATYPLVNDGDADNTGAGVDVATWTFEYLAGDFSSALITDGMIGVGAHGAAKPILTHFEFTGGVFEKTSSDTLKVIVNHTFNGV